MDKYFKNLTIVFRKTFPYVRFEIWKLNSSKLKHRVSILKEVNDDDAKWKELGVRQLYYSLMARKQGKFV